MKKNTLILIFSVVVLSSCTPTPPTSINDIIEKADGKYYLLESDKLFSGTVEKISDSGDRKFVSKIRDGVFIGNPLFLIKPNEVNQKSKVTVAGHPGWYKLQWKNSTSPKYIDGELWGNSFDLYRMKSHAKKASRVQVLSDVYSEGLDYSPSPLNTEWKSLYGDESGVLKYEWVESYSEAAFFFRDVKKPRFSAKAGRSKAVIGSYAARASYDIFLLWSREIREKYYVHYLHDNYEDTIYSESTEQNILDFVPPKHKIERNKDGSIKKNTLCDKICAVRMRIHHDGKFSHHFGYANYKDLPLSEFLNLWRDYEGHKSENLDKFIFAHNQYFAQDYSKIIEEAYIDSLKKNDDFWKIMISKSTGKVQFKRVPDFSEPYWSEVIYW
jgi:hypothetical protein